MKTRVNRKINNFRGDTKEAKNHKVKMQHNNPCKREDAIGYCLSHNIYLNWGFIGRAKKGRCIECNYFVKINNKKGERL